MWPIGNCADGERGESNMVTSSDPLDVGKKRTQVRKSEGLVKGILLNPRTWKAATMALDFGLKLFRLVAKAWDYFG